VRRSSVLLFILTTLLLSSCIHIKMIRNLESDAENSLWIQGINFIKIEHDSIYVVCGLNNINNYEMIFDVEIGNYSSDTFMVNPPEFRYEIVEVWDSLITRSTSIYYAKNPEKSIKNYKQALENENQNLEVDQVINVIGSLFELASDINNAVNGREETEEEREEKEDVCEERDLNELKHINRIQKLNEKMNFWSKEVMRKTTMKPGFVIAGKVIFPVDQNAKNIKKFFELNGKDYVIPYRVIKN